MKMNSLHYTDVVRGGSFGAEARFSLASINSRPRPISAPRELPSAVNGLSLTEELALTLMAEPLPDWGAP
jgi:hypothetical protein